MHGKQASILDMRLWIGVRGVTCLYSQLNFFAKIVIFLLFLFSSLLLRAQPFLAGNAALVACFSHIKNFVLLDEVGSQTCSLFKVRAMWKLRYTVVSHKALFWWVSHSFAFLSGAKLFSPNYLTDFMRNGWHSVISWKQFCEHYLNCRTRFLIHADANHSRILTI